VSDTAAGKLWVPSVTNPGANHRSSRAAASVAVSVLTEYPSVPKRSNEDVRHAYATLHRVRLDTQSDLEGNPEVECYEVKLLSRVSRQRSRRHRGSFCTVFHSSASR